VAETRTTFPAGGRVGEYQILGVIGAGGMGVVYKALDPKLERTVALKFLPHDAHIDEKQKEQFLREAKAASGLDHTNIGVIHGLEETPDGQLYIVMAYYEGKTLAQLIKEGPVPVARAVDISMQMARGLAEAHSRNIVHRDIKPSNLILTNQNVLKIVDFGLALVVSAETATQTLGVAGTVAYMSPEQGLGLLVDQRSDIWSLGVVMAEMLTGRHAFQRENLSQVLLAIMNEPPLPLDAVPTELQRIVYHALAKNPAERYQSCRELLADLEKVKAADSAPTISSRGEGLGKYLKQASSSALPAMSRKRSWRWPIAAASVLVLLVAVLLFVPQVRQRVGDFLAAGTEKHIAVLPFENIGKNPANEPLAQGLMDSLSSKLSNLDVGRQSLWVVPATVVRQRRVTEPTAALRELGATLVVEGSIQRGAQGVQLTVNLINTKTLRQVGSVQLEDRAGDLSALENDAVARLARLMHIEITPEMLRNTGGHVTPAAYESYLTALGYIQRYDKAGNLDLAITALDGAVKTDPRFALGYAELCDAYRLKYQLDQNPRWVDEASAHCAQAAQLDDRLPVVYVTLGRMHSSLGKADLALQEFQRALDLNPRDPSALLGQAGAYERIGRTADAEATFKKAVALRPDYWDGYSSLGLFYLRQRRYDEAIQQLRRVLELTPDNAQTYSNLGVALHNSQKNVEAEAAYKKAIELAPSYAAYVNLGTLYYTQKRWAESAALTEKALQLNDKDFRVWANLALSYRRLNQTEQAAASRKKELERLEDIVRLQPNDATVHAALGIIYAEMKQRDKAISQIQAALALAPNDPRFCIDAGEVYEDLGDRKQALSYIEQGLKKGFRFDDLKDRPEFQNLLADPNFRPPAK
jgi:serine/threonine-protein kinase